MTIGSPRRAAALARVFRNPWRTIRDAGADAMLRHLAWSVRWTPTGQYLYALRASARRHGHRPARWRRLFWRHDPYHVYWTRCRDCWAAGRLTVIREGQEGHDARRHIPTGALFTRPCTGRRTTRRR